MKARLCIVAAIWFVLFAAWAVPQLRHPFDQCRGGWVSIGHELKVRWVSVQVHPRHEPVLVPVPHRPQFTCGNYNWSGSLVEAHDKTPDGGKIYLPMGIYRFERGNKK